MNKPAHLKASALAIFLLLTLLSGCDEKIKTENKIYTLKSYRNTVALYDGDEIVTVYSAVVLDNLPITDRAALNSGIDFTSIEAAEQHIEDYDG